MTSVLSGSEISSLFDHEDLERISLELKREALRQGVQDTKEAIFQFFLQRVKQKLHVVLSTTPAGTSFRRRCRLNPPLINCCTIDWFDKWPLDALQSVAISFLEASELDKEQQSNRDLKASVSKVFVEVYRSVEEETQTFFDELHRRYYTTPTSYMEFVRLYLSKLNQKRAEFSFNRDRLCIGLQKLSESNALVGTMQTELLQLGPKLEQKAKVCGLGIGKVTERFSFQCRKTKTNVITLTNHNSRKQSHKPIRARSKYHVARAKRGKARARKSRLVLV